MPGPARPWDGPAWPWPWPTWRRTSDIGWGAKGGGNPRRNLIVGSMIRPSTPPNRQSAVGGATESIIPGKGLERTGAQTNKRCRDGKPKQGVWGRGMGVKRTCGSHPQVIG